MDKADNSIQFRIGINVGDIMIDGDDIFGDGVNVAARLEALAEPGGIMVSGVVHDQVRDKLSFGFEDLGQQSVKNIARPVGVHRVSLVPSTAESAIKSAAAPKLETAASQRPSIAMLPFDNMSGDPEQEYFADGISEDIITGLSKLRWFIVIARNSSFAYKGKAVDFKRVARELGVRYVLEGSVRKGGNRVRITAQLIDAATAILHRRLLAIVRDDEVCRRLMTVPGVGPVVALTYRVTVDVPARFRHSKSVGAVSGLTCSKYQSGEINRTGAISKCGDEMMRMMLYEAAQVMLTRTNKWSWLKAWAMKIARRRGMKKAIVALARRLAVVMHRIWVDGTEFQWTREAAVA